MRRQPSKHATLLLGYLSDDNLTHITDEALQSLTLRRLFHESMSIMLNPLEDAGANGVMMPCADGNVRNVFPIVMAYVCDHPEQCLVAGIKQSYSPICEVQPNERGKLTDYPYRSRARSIQALANKLAKVRDPAFQDLGLKLIKPFWLNLPHIDLDTVFTPDLLHQLHKGMFQTHLLMWLRKMLTDDEIDRRFQAITQYPGMRHFGHGISHLSQLTGKEQKEMEKALMLVIAGCTALPKDAVIAASALLNFIYLARYPIHSESTLGLMEESLKVFHNHKQIFEDEGVCKSFDGIPKLHSLQHYACSIRNKGAADGYSTESPERLHIDFAKKGYQASSKNDYLSQMVKWLQRQETMNYQRSYLAWCEGYRSFIDHRSAYISTRMPNEWDLDTLDDASLAQASMETDTAEIEQLDAFEERSTENTPNQAPGLVPFSPGLPTLLDMFHILDTKSKADYRLAKKPMFSHQSTKQIAERYGLPDFDFYFFEYFKNHDSNIYQSYSEDVGLNIWKAFWLAVPKVCDMSYPSKWSKLFATPASERQNHLRTKKIPAKYSTVLAIWDHTAQGLHRK